ncbi:unnamed protein product [Mytilus edulis]|uniref:Uncharacterized protein n=1 Tax=Mytilus edulis TaxID=6550 RepID=A0A8S3U6W5_MYTED|nr:unnamed protein product [Mytilus edulis]
MLNKEFFVEGQPSELSLFDLPPTQVGVENIRIENVRPTSTISDSSPILFDISGQNGLEYLDLFNSQIHVTLRVLHDDNSVLGVSEDVAPVNLFLQSLFSQIDVSIQGKALSTTSGYYPYKAYIQTLLRYGSDAKQSQLSTQLWLKDTSGHFDDVDFSNGDNTNGIVRMSYIQESKLLDLQGPIMHDLFQSSCPNKLIIAFINSEATGVGNLTRNPWNFQNYNLSQIGLSVDGIPVNGGPLQLSYNNKTGCTVVEVLSNLLMATRKWLNDEGIDINRDDIPSGYALYAFDTQPDFDGNEYLSLKKQGSLRIDAVFNTALPHTVNCIVLAERQGYFEISQSRDVILNSDGY